MTSVRTAVRIITFAIILLGSGAVMANETMWKRLTTYPWNGPGDERVWIEKGALVNTLVVRNERRDQSEGILEEISGQFQIRVPGWRLMGIVMAMGDRDNPWYVIRWEGKDVASYWSERSFELIDPSHKPPYAGDFTGSNTRRTSVGDHGNGDYTLRNEGGKYAAAKINSGIIYSSWPWRDGKLQGKYVAGGNYILWQNGTWWKRETPQ